MHAKTCASVLPVMALLLAAAPAAAANISVPLDEVRILAFAQPVSTVYVGNPVVADVTVIDPRHVFVLGKSYGTTNMIALGSDGKAVANEHVTVFGHSAATVTLQRGANQVTYACAARICEAAPVPGDDKDAFAASLAEIAAHQGLGARAASSQTASNNTPQ